MVIVTALIATAPTSASEFDVDKFLNNTYVTVGIAHKLRENTIKYKGVPIEQSPTARIEVFYQYSKHVKFGISHHSQWLLGKPFNDKAEYSKTEIFIDYTFSLGDL